MLPRLWACHVRGRGGVIDLLALRGAVTVCRSARDSRTLTQTGSTPFRWRIASSESPTRLILKVDALEGSRWSAARFGINRSDTKVRITARGSTRTSRGQAAVRPREVAKRAK